mmetsp:Transcript_24777/g.32370  ORF Transcript_24777/g.32370 Transcript_24777/m.32370 type:complete len:124 (-) Transcript_24777:287-658(-)
MTLIATDSTSEHGSLIEKVPFANLPASLSFTTEHISLYEVPELTEKSNKRLYRYVCANCNFTFTFHVFSPKKRVNHFCSKDCKTSFLLRQLESKFHNTYTQRSKIETLSKDTEWMIFETEIRN